MSTSSTEGPLALDLDGTLVDPRPRQVGALLALLEAEPRSGAVDADALWERKRDGMSTVEALRDLGFGEDASERLGDRWRATVEDAELLTLDRLIPGVADALAGLAAAEPRPVILTARQHADRARAQVGALGLLEWCAEVRVVQPDSAADSKAAELERLGCRGMVGDTESDAWAAAMAGIAFVGVATGQRSPAYLRARGLRVCDSLAEALSALDGSDL